MAFEGNGAENGGPGASNAAGRMGGPNNGPGYHTETAANRNYYKAPPGQRVVFRKGEESSISTGVRGPGGTTPIARGAR